MEFTQEESALLETLTRATSQDVNLLKSAEEKLNQWEVEPGYYSALMKIILNSSINPTVRWLAASVLKNGVNKYWRRTAPNAISELEKNFLKTMLLKTFTESDNAVAILLAVVISKIARSDYPKEWPTLLPNIVEVIKSGDVVAQHRGLVTLNQVIKALASKRLFVDRKNFQIIAKDIYVFMLNFWNALFQTFTVQMNNFEFVCDVILEKILLTLKILHKLTIGLYQSSTGTVMTSLEEVVNLDEDVTTFIMSLFTGIKNMFLFRSCNSGYLKINEMCEKVICHMNKVLLTFLESQPLAFLRFVQPSLNYVRIFLFSDSKEFALFEKFIIQCLNLMKNIILCPAYKLLCAKRLDYERHESAVVVEANRLKAEFFQTEVVEEICTKLITHYFLLTPKDLQLWEDDPESFAFDDAGDSWRFYLHPCTHSLYLAFLREYREVLSSLVLKLVRNNQQIVDPQDLDGILKKDAVYRSIGLGAFDFYDEVDFDQWFNTTLVHELAIKDSNYRIIRRRVVWLIGKWTDVNPAVELRPAICGTVIPLLNSDEDMVVRLTSAITLKSIVDSLEFRPDQFMDFLGPSFSLLFSLLQEVKECSTKMQILDVLSSIVGRVGEEIRPYSQSLIQYLPLLWEANHNMLRCAVVSTLVQFVRGLVSENLTSFLYPVIECCTDMSNDDHVYLLEDGLKLWFTVIEYSPELTPELLSLYRNIPIILENTLEHFECCCDIIQEYILLSPEKFLAECGEPLMTLFLSLLSDVNDRGREKILQITETAIKGNPEIAIKLSSPLLVYLTHRLLEIEFWSFEASMYFTLIGRVMLYSKDLFLDILRETANAKSLAVEVLLDKILRLWNRISPLVSRLEQRKLWALALSSLLTVQWNIVLSQFASIIQTIVEVLNDIMDIDFLSAEMNSMKLFEDQTLINDDVTDDDTKIEKRKKQLNETDPVYKIELRVYLQSQMNDLRSQIGSSQYERLIETVDPEILRQCRTYISI